MFPDCAVLCSADSAIHIDFATFFGFGQDKYQMTTLITVGFEIDRSKILLTWNTAIHVFYSFITTHYPGANHVEG